MPTEPKPFLKVKDNTHMANKPFDKNPHRKITGKPAPKREFKRDFSRSPSRPTITNPGIKKYMSLKSDKGRMKFQQFIAENPKIIREIARQTPDIVRDVYFSSKCRDDELIAMVKKTFRYVHKVPHAELEQLSDTECQQGIIAVADYCNLRPNWAYCRYVTILDCVQDPGNVGAIIRTSVALGMDAILLGKGCCDIYNPKVVRSSAGLFLRLPFEAGVDLLSKVSFLRQKGFTIVATSSHATYTIDQIKLRKKVAIIVSNEGSGIGDKLNTLADEIVKIPIKTNVESLNVGVAHGILAHQLVYSRD